LEFEIPDTHLSRLGICAENGTGLDCEIVISIVDTVLFKSASTTVRLQVQRGSAHALLHHAHGAFEPHRVILGNHGPVDPFAQTLPGDEERSLAYPCTGSACQPPTREGSAVAAFLREAPAPESPY
jgi:uncharacterized protein YyaL (SSP411 family)